MFKFVELAQFNQYLGILTIAGLALVGILLLVWLVSIFSGTNPLKSLRKLWLLGALVVMVIAVFGSLSYSLVYGLAPCDLCWYQRIAIYPLLPVLFLGVVFRVKDTASYAIVFALTGIAVSAYHYLIQQAVIAGDATVCDAAAGCARIYVNEYGFITIPLMALTASALVLIMVLLSRGNAGTKSRSRAKKA